MVWSDCCWNINFLLHLQNPEGTPHLITDPPELLTIRTNISKYVTFSNSQGRSCLVRGDCVTDRDLALDLNTKTPVNLCPIISASAAKRNSGSGWVPQHTGSGVTETHCRVAPSVYTAGSGATAPPVCPCVTQHNQGPERNVWNHPHEMVTSIKKLYFEWTCGGFPESRTTALLLIRALFVDSAV